MLIETGTRERADALPGRVTNVMEVRLHTRRGTGAAEDCPAMTRPMLETFTESVPRRDDGERGDRDA
ncbi:hypothetical protein [Streptosporangium sp. NPDC002721]|uniref:hypothetical protein n=1 Tax=Streptosporangium sp. NPDC002721 TaxID=3366188 RepID=UPI0036C94FBB